MRSRIRGSRATVGTIPDQMGERPLPIGDSLVDPEKTIATLRRAIQSLVRGINSGPSINCKIVGDDDFVAQPFGREFEEFVNEAFVFSAAFPDRTYTLDEMAAEGDTVASR